MNESDTTGTTVAAANDAGPATTAHDRPAALTAIGSQHYQYKRPPALQLQQVLTDTLPPSVPLPSLRQQRQIRHAASARPAADYTESPPDSPIVQAKRPPVKSASAGAHRVNAAASRRESSKLNINGQPKRKRTKTGCWTCRCVKSLFAYCDDVDGLRPYSFNPATPARLTRCVSAILSRTLLYAVMCKCIG